MTFQSIGFLKIVEMSQTTVTSRKIFIELFWYIIRYSRSTYILIIQ